MLADAGDGRGAEITTSTIRLRLLSVGAPGTGRAARDYTPISDLSIVGTFAEGRVLLDSAD